ncbi:hypothetical protein [Burkholderia stagnalis]|uniref:hypothetical protein n=1 Tax=Burkholderia stagnalis TaxID=1503054 RepID=UPI0018C715BD|nr:hypothetical protein [Burkholderia stagnalis]
MFLDGAGQSLDGSARQHSRGRRRRSLYSAVYYEAMKMRRAVGRCAFGCSEGGMDERVQQAQQDGFADGGLSARIVPLKRREDGPRAERIASVVDAFGRLRGSVVRFVALLARRDAAALAPDASDVMPFDALLQALAAHAERTGFHCLPELNRCIERAGTAERHRDVIFAQAPPASDAALRNAAAMLERLDAEFVGLCVAHVLACHPAHPLPADAATMPRGGRAIVA